MRTKGSTLMLATAMLAMAGDIGAGTYGQPAPSKEPGKRCGGKKKSKRNMAKASRRKNR